MDTPATNDRVTNIEPVFRPSVYAFTDLATYLRAYCDYKRSRNRTWSLRGWSRRLGLSGSGTLSNFISGRRKIGDDLCEKIRVDLKLSPHERIYFDALLFVHWSEREIDPLWTRLTEWLRADETGSTPSERTAHD